MKNQKLTWDEIKERYKGQWVELVDFEWDWSHVYPSSARVRNSSSDRFVLLGKMQDSGNSSDSVVLFVGAIGCAAHVESNIASV